MTGNKDAVYSLTTITEHAQQLKLHTINLTTEHAIDLLKRIVELDADSGRLRYFMEESGIDGFGLYDACDFIERVSAERGHDDPTEDDEFEGWRRLIDAVMKESKSDDSNRIPTEPRRPQLQTPGTARNN